jgi:hypothetical protein
MIWMRDRDGLVPEAGLDVAVGRRSRSSLQRSGRLSVVRQTFGGKKFETDDWRKGEEGAQRVEVGESLQALEEGGV